MIFEFSLIPIKFSEREINLISWDVLGFFVNNTSKYLNCDTYNC